MDTFQHAISIIEKGTAKNLAFLQKEIDTRNSNSIRTALIRRKTYLKVKSFQRTVLMMMKRTTEQITDVTRGNTAALVGIDQFL